VLPEQWKQVLGTYCRSFGLPYHVLLEVNLFFEFKFTNADWTVFSAIISHVYNTTRLGDAKRDSEFTSAYQT
jgi:hypothetical protein